MTTGLRILLVHESYISAGGEDRAVDADARFLVDKGHTVSRWSISNKEIPAWSPWRKAQLLWQTSWSRPAYRTLISLLHEQRPDIVHFHNTLPIISPSAIRAAHAAGVPVVMTLHNYRLMCPPGTYFREGRVCEDCRLHSLARGVLHGCYRGSSVQTGAVALMLATHRRLRTWRECVDIYIALTEFMRAKVVEGGIQGEKVHVRPNTITIPPGHDVRPEDYAVFVGRLSPEKGIATLIDAARRMDGRRIKVIGGGPLEQELRKAARGMGSRFEILGQIPHAETLEAVRRARVLLFPSVWYEGLPTTILEALACGVPVVASRLGAMSEMLTDGQEGFLVTPGDSTALADRSLRILSDDDLRTRMSVAAKSAFESRYSSDRCYEKLVMIYRLASEAARARRQVV